MAEVVGREQGSSIKSPVSTCLTQSWHGLSAGHSEDQASKGCHGVRTWGVNCQHERSCRLPSLSQVFWSGKGGQDQGIRAKTGIFFNGKFPEFRRHTINQPSPLLPLRGVSPKC